MKRPNLGCAGPLAPTVARRKPEHGTGPLSSQTSCAIARYRGPMPTPLASSSRIGAGARTRSSASPGGASPLSSGERWGPRSCPPSPHHSHPGSALSHVCKASLSPKGSERSSHPAPHVVGLPCISQLFPALPAQ